ncbi:sulfurtransferase TusA family protein [Nonomuraea angiospora]|uniref:sulfurtransferase TusA family protein n=1 Tax=Nonomuraea angiospora TaxID=46172 RepID=UPI001788EE67|nr:sulfurtransferase TusA family protein [Nonomuraea angiospora]
MLCITLLVRLRAAIANAEPGTLVHIIATDPAAPLDLPAWCHLTGHTYLGPLRNRQQPTYALRVSGQARPVDPDAPWRPDNR